MIWACIIVLVIVASWVFAYEAGKKDATKYYGDAADIINKYIKGGKDEDHR